MKYAIVRSNRLNSFGTSMNSDICTVMNMFNISNVFDIIILELCLKLRFHIPDRFFNSELVDVNADAIIVFDGHARREFLKWLSRENIGKRLIFWCWNTVEEIENNLTLNKIPPEYEIWSYSKHDCQTYNFQYNTTFYWNEEYVDKNKKIQNDIYFVGKDKGRLAKIKEIENVCKKVGISTLFEVTGTHKWNFDPYYSKPVSYARVLERISESRAILDVKVSSTAGPSLRAVEAAFYKKLLITDDDAVVDFKFFDCNNVLILDSTYTGEDIKKFLMNSYKSIDSEKIQYYSFTKWLMRFEKSGE